MAPARATFKRDVRTTIAINSPRFPGWERARCRTFAPADGRMTGLPPTSIGLSASSSTQQAGPGCAFTKGITGNDNTGWLLKRDPGANNRLDSRNYEAPLVERGGDGDCPAFGLQTLREFRFGVGSKKVAASAKGG